MSSECILSNTTFSDTQTRSKGWSLIASHEKLGVWQVRVLDTCPSFQIRAKRFIDSMKHPIVGAARCPWRIKKNGQLGATHLET